MKAVAFVFGLLIVATMAALGALVGGLAGMGIYWVFGLFAPAAWCVLTYAQAFGIGCVLALLPAVFR